MFDAAVFLPLSPLHLTSITSALLPHSMSLSSPPSTSVSLVFCLTGSITGTPSFPTIQLSNPLPSGILNLIYTDMFSQHRKQPMPFNKITVQPANKPRGWSAGTNHRGPWLYHFLLRNEKKFQNADFFVFPLSVRQLCAQPKAYLAQWELMYSITAFIWASFVTLNDLDDKGGNDGDVNALSAALTDPRCTAVLWSVSLRRLSNLALKLTLLMGLCFPFLLSYHLIPLIPAFLFEPADAPLFIQAVS